MPVASRQAATPAILRFSTLKNCFVNLPQSFVDTAITINAPAQDVIVEVLVKDNAAPKNDGKALQRSVYAGWSGMPSTQKSPALYSSASRTADKGVVEIDAIFARMLNLIEGQEVGIRLHIDPPLAHTVHIEPLTQGDWQVIELHANFLELNLLSQIRALPNPSTSESPSIQAQHAHPLTLHLSPTSTANIIVTSLVPPLASSVPFAKLAPDAEVLVAPKTRPRINERKGSRSIASAGRKSAGEQSSRSTGRNGTLSDESSARKSVLLRPCDRSFCDVAFEAEDNELGSNTGLKIWVDPELLEDNAWNSVSYVSVSIVQPSAVESSTDAEHQQRRKDRENNHVGKPATTVVAKLLPWYDSPGPCHAALSSMLCSSLLVRHIVGGMIEVKAAPQPASNRSVQSLQIVPFTPVGDRKSESIRFGGDPQTERDPTLSNFQRCFNSPESYTSFKNGPLTDGLLIPSFEDEDPQSSWHGGVLRIVWQPRTKGDSETTTPAWVNGLHLGASMEIGREMINPLQQTRSSTIDACPGHIGSVIGVDNISNELFADLSHSSSVLLTGGLGSGKSSIAKSLACQLRSRVQCYVSYIGCRELTVDEVRVSTVKESFERLFTSATWAVRLGGQALVILDDLDKLCPVITELQTQDNGRSNQISELLCNITRRHCSKTLGVTLLATAQGQDSLNSLLVGANLFKNIVNLKAPDKERRRRLLLKMVGGVGVPQDVNTGVHEHGPNIGTIDQAGWMDGSPLSSPAKSSGGSLAINYQLDLLDVAGQTDGYMPADLALLVSRAKSEALIRSVASGDEGPSEATITNEDFACALKGFAPASLRNVTLQSSKTTFGSIGGLKSTRKIILETLQYPTLYAPIFAHCPLRLRSGLLLYGYPGCGKTLLASAVAGECGLNFISVKGPEILNKYIGASEKSVRDLFERAESARPCVLFFDEFDSIAPKRGHDSTGVTDRVVNQLLTQMDGAEGLSGVYVLAATSRPDLIDPALLRPGRLDKSILCDLPDFDDRLDILTVISKKLKMDPKIKSKQRQSLYEVARQTEGYSGADLQAVIYNAHLEAIHDRIGDHEISGIAGKRTGKVETVQQITKSDILQFRFGKEADGEGGSTGVNRTRELAEYQAIIAKFDGMKRMRRIERRKMREPPATKFEGDGRTDVHEGDGVQQVTIQWKHIEASLTSTRSSISSQERQRLKQFYREFEVGRSGELPNGEASTEVGGRSSLM